MLESWHNADISLNRVLNNNPVSDFYVTCVNDQHDFAIIVGTMASLLTSASQCNGQHWLKQRLSTNNHLPNFDVTYV